MPKHVTVALNIPFITPCLSINESINQISQSISEMKAQGADDVQFPVL